jgi:hypothetical protein
MAMVQITDKVLTAFNGNKPQLNQLGHAGLLVRLWDDDIVIMPI